jgi:thymidylate kinase
VTDRQFSVLLGPDYAGKSSVMARLSDALPGWRTLSTDAGLVAREHELIARLRRDVLTDVLPGIGSRYSVEFLAHLLGTAVVHLRDQLERADQRTPVLMDSYYYKILAKCRLAGLAEHPLYARWRSFRQPSMIIYLDVPPETAWRRSGAGARLNPLEFFGSRPEWFAFDSYQKNLRKLMLEEIGHRPVTVIDASAATDLTATAVRKALAA